jgi:drug/metabolite transporter (DMT)-like permease
MVAAGLWAADGLFRATLTQTIPASSIVFFEHVIGFLILIPFFVKGIPSFKKLTKKDWGVALLLTLVSSVLGTILFTESLAKAFEVFDFATPILLQKLQPVFVIGLSWLILKEKLSIKFLGLTIIALIGSYLISFGGEAINLQFEGKELVYILAIGAAFAWGAGTIMSKYILKKLSFTEATSLRFLLAIPVSLIFVFALKETYSPLDLDFSQIWRFVVIAFTTGAGAIVIYYRGLRNTEAKVATIAELTFPVVSIAIAITNLNPYGDAQKLLLTNVFGIVILLISIIIIGFDHAESQKSKQ